MPWPCAPSPAAATPPVRNDQHVLQLARDCAAVTIYLEVRASNQAGRALYARHSFAEIGIRKGYYPAHDGREDAVTMEKKLA